MNAKPQRKPKDMTRIGDRDVPTTDLWATPQWLVDRLQARWGFGLDAAATGKSAIVGPYLGPDQEDPELRDALAFTPWRAAFSPIFYGEAVFCNPPYSRSCGGITRWVEAFAREGRHCPVVAVLPATPDCSWWQRAFLSAAEVTLFPGRVHFVPPPGVAQSSPRCGTAIFAWVPKGEGPARVRWDTIPRAGRGEG